MKKPLCVIALLMTPILALAADTVEKETSEISAQVARLTAEPNGKKICVLQKGTQCNPLTTMQDNSGKRWTKIAIVGWVETSMVKNAPVAKNAVSAPPKTMRSTSSKPSRTPPPQAIGKWDGFREIPWGTKLSDSAQEFSQVTDDKRGTTIWLRNGDKLRIGQADLDEIAYGFYKDRFAFAFIKASGSQNFEALKKALIARYGRAKQPNQFIEEYAWYREDVFISLELNEFTSETTLTFFYMPLQAQREHDEQVEAAKADGDF